MIGITLEVIIVIVIIILQISSFRENARRMRNYVDIFKGPDTWKVERDENGLVTNISGGSSSPYFRDIKRSINKYVANNNKSVVEFGILKDAVDRQCDAIEDEVEVQTPVPLYLGLAGTMIGIITGLIALLVNDSLSNLMTGTSTQISPEVASAASVNAANGVTHLLWGVAIAMIASFVGIILTTRTSYIFKNLKQDAEDSRSTFITWIQARLLPQLPNDMSGALSGLVTNLENFNRTFVQNTNNLGQVLSAVNESYASQAELLRQVQGMNLVEVASQNIAVLRELNSATDRLRGFNEYLRSLSMTTQTIREFNEEFLHQENIVNTLTQIKDFFEREVNAIDQRRAMIEQKMVSVDQRIGETVDELNSTASDRLRDYGTEYLRQAESLRESMNAVENEFKQQSDLMKAAFEEQLRALPSVAQQMSRVSEIPSQLQGLANAIQSSQQKMEERMLQRLNSTAATGQNTEHSPAIPGWVKAVVLAFLIILAISGIGTMIFSIMTYHATSSASQRLGEFSAQSPNIEAVDTMDEMNTVAPSVNAQSGDSLMTPQPKQ